MNSIRTVLGTPQEHYNSTFPSRHTVSSVLLKHFHLSPAPNLFLHQFLSCQNPYNACFIDPHQLLATEILTVPNPDDTRAPQNWTTNLFAMSKPEAYPSFPLPATAGFWVSISIMLLVTLRESQNIQSWKRPRRSSSPTPT